MIELRPARFSDYTTISSLHAESWRMTYRGILSDQYLDSDVEQDRLNIWHQRFKSPPDNQAITVALSDETIIGFCCLYLHDDPVFGSLIDNLHVASLYQNSGIGKMLIKESARIICKHATLKAMYLWVYEANKNARIAYDHFGGTCIETIEKENPDGTSSRVCRIVWDDASKFLI